jgi:hypothetical protein
MHIICRSVPPIAQILLGLDLQPFRGDHRDVEFGRQKHFQELSMVRGATDKSLSIGSYTVSRDCRFTTFSVVRLQKGRPKRRGSCIHQRNYELSQFEVSQDKEKCANIRLYVALHNERFHVVVSGSDAAAIATIESQITAEEHTRQRLQWIYTRQSGLNAMTVHERSSHEMQYEKVSRVLREWRDSARPFSSFRWDGQENSAAMDTTDPMNPCLLCEARMTHMVPIMRFDVAGVMQNQTRTFADSSVNMWAELNPNNEDTEDRTLAGRRDVVSRWTLFKRRIRSLPDVKAKEPKPHISSPRMLMLTCTEELQERMKSANNRSRNVDLIDDVAS